MDTLTLTRHDLLFTNSLHRHTVRVLPSSKKKHQKIVIGDESGTLTAIQIKNKAPQTVFRLPPGKRDITALEVSGDKIYTAFGHSIHGVLKKKGQTFLQYSTPLSEDIHHLSLNETGDSIYTACEYSLNSFSLPTKQQPAMKEGMFYQTPDRIGGIAAVGDGVIVGTADKYIRLLRDSEVISDLRVHAAVSTLSKGGNSLWYGAEGGGVGELKVSSDDVKLGKFIENAHHKQSVTAITSVDLALTGTQDVVIGHDDGTFHLFSSSSSSSTDPLYTYEMHESIVSLDSGAIHHPDSADLVLATYSGKVLTFGHDTSADKIVGKIAQSDVNEKHKVMVGLQSDIDGLAKQVATYKEKLNRLQINSETGSGPSQQQQMESNISALSIKSNYRLSRDEACYVLSLEIPIAIDICVLHCPFSLHVTEASTAGLTVQSIQQPEPSNPEYLCTLRCTSSINRLSLHIRHAEGQSALLTAHVLPRAPPSPLLPRVAGKVQLSLKPLHLHDKVDKSIVSGRDGLSSLVMSGGFSLSEIHTWLSLCLPGIPPHVDAKSSSDDDGVDLFYQNVYSLSILMIRYRKGYVRLESENLSALSIIKEFISREAIQKKIQMNINFQYNPQTVPSFLQRLKQKLDYFFLLQYRVSLIAALEELKQHEEKYTDFLEEKYVEILKNGDSLKEQWKTAPLQLDLLRKLLVNLFVDKGKLQGKDLSRQAQKVNDALDKYSFDGLLAVFKD